MLELSDAVGSAGLFAGVIGLLFSSWFDNISKNASQRVADRYNDRKPDFERLTSTLLSRALPLLLVLTAFVYANLSVILQVFDKEKLHIPFVDDPSTLDVNSSVFVIVYVLMVYFAVLLASLVVSLVGRILEARKGRGGAKAAIHWLG